LQNIDSNYWNNQEYEYYALKMYLPIELYVKIMNECEKIEKVILNTVKHLTKEFHNDEITTINVIPIVDNESKRNNDDNKIQMMQGFIAEIEKIMISVATGESRIDDVNDKYKKIKEELDNLLHELSITNPNKYGDLWEWSKRWKSDDMPTDQLRREFVLRLYINVKEYTKTNEISHALDVNPTGFTKVDRMVEKIKELFEKAEHEEDFQTLGIYCRQLFVDIALIVYKDEMNTNENNISKADSFKMIEAFINFTLKGESNETLRRFAKSAHALANELTHKQKIDRKTAALCFQATMTLLNIINILVQNKQEEE
jgi:hypothetical protein